MKEVIIFLIIIAAAGYGYFYGFESSEPIEYEESEYYDFESDPIKEAISDIKLRSPTDYSKLRNTVRYVHNNVQYEVQPGSVCIQETASDILNNGKGDCTGMSKSIVAILRGMGIEATMAGGCVSQYYTCTHTYAITGELLKRPFVIYNPDGSYAGGFHAWVEARAGDNWYILDGTDGSIVESNCQDFWKSGNPSDDDINAMCYETNPNILSSCQAFTII